MRDTTGLHAAALGAAIAVAAASCYPAFDFGPSGAGGATSSASHAASSSAGGSTGSTGSTGTGGQGGGASASSSAASSSAMSSSAASSSAGTGGAAGCGIGHLVISEIRSRGDGGATDEFVELWNPGDAPVALDGTWALDARSAAGASYGVKWTAKVGETIPGRGHFLLGGSGYFGPPFADDTLAGITDAASLRLTHSGAPVDVVCYAYDGNTQGLLLGGGFSCEGTPMSNLPHDDVSNAASNQDQSIERKPGAGLGSCTDSGNNAGDFAVAAPSTPESTSSPVAP